MCVKLSRGIDEPDGSPALMCLAGGHSATDINLTLIHRLLNLMTAPKNYVDTCQYNLHSVFVGFSLTCSLVHCADAVNGNIQYQKL